MSVTPERRSATRIDKVFRVLLSTEEGGDQWFIARNISATGIFVEMREPLPLRTKVIIRFQLLGDDDSLCAMARVQNHYYLQFTDHDGLRAISGVGLRFLRFLPEIGAPIPAERLH